jgi:hypothetical protein
MPVAVLPLSSILARNLILAPPLYGDFGRPGDAPPESGLRCRLAIGTVHDTKARFLRRGPRIGECLLPFVPPLPIFVFAASFSYLAAAQAVNGYMGIPLVDVYLIHRGYRGLSVTEQTIAPLRILGPTAQF